MHSSILYSIALVAGIVSAVPAGKRDFSPDNVYFPLKNGFPNPSQDQILQIQIEGHGTLPNAPPPPKLSPEGVTNLKLVAFNELFEVAYFTELVYNLTNKVQGYDLGYGHEYVLDSLKSIVAQEQMHLLNANGGLKRFNQETIQPCKYSFGVTDFQSAIALAATFTDLVLGTLQDVNQIFADNGDTRFVRSTSSSLGNEAEQEGFYRLVQKKRPSAQPFLTTATRDFLFTAVQSYTIPGSCPNLATIKLKTFKPLTIESKDIKPATQNIKFSTLKKDASSYNTDQLRVVFLNGQNVPIVKKLDKVNMLADKVVFEAAFPYAEFRMDGLTVAAVTSGKTEFANAAEVPCAFTPLSPPTPPWYSKSTSTQTLVPHFTYPSTTMNSDHRLNTPHPNTHAPCPTSPDCDDASQHLESPTDHVHITALMTHTRPQRASTMPIPPYEAPVLAPQEPPLALGQHISPPLLAPSPLATASAEESHYTFPRTAPQPPVPTPAPAPLTSLPHAHIPPGPEPELFPQDLPPRPIYLGRQTSKWAHYPLGDASA
ncbi:hypothetical protein CC86DRAFT_404971 [Ophiobolus disseminans]|uniref:Late sexual development protein n=1 Tax=Ophiobolus disseminans TaxID=1469910 RepID=A0A6A7A582_9PLEO|nr:hypothetical protein CC86DRAFT_404971 [Ophiobolus disseminans]